MHVHRVRAVRLIGERGSSTKQMVPELVAEGSLEGALVCSRSHMLRLRSALASKGAFRAHRCAASLSFPLPVLCLPFNLLPLDAVAGSILDGASSGSFEASHPATTSNAPIQPMGLIGAAHRGALGRRKPPTVPRSHRSAARSQQPPPSYVGR